LDYRADASNAAAIDMIKEFVVEQVGALQPA